MNWNKNKMNPCVDWVSMGDIYDFNSGEWGEIVYEESSSNRRKREGPRKNLGMTLLMSGLMDLALVGILVYLWSMTEILSSLPWLVFLILIAFFVCSGLIFFVIGWSKLKYSAKPISILEKGIVENSFTAFEEMPVIELRGAKQSLMLSRSGSAIVKPDLASAKDKKGYVKDIYLPEELDFIQFKESLEKLGYGDGQKEGPGPKPSGKDDKGPSEDGTKSPQNIDETKK
jgi:hypothetical protein